jgi:hypothetical protein
MMSKSDKELRDWYAGLAMQAHLEHDLREMGVSTDDDIAEITAAAFKIANMMISQRAYEDIEVD